MFNDIQKLLNLKDPNVTFSDDCIETHNNQLYITATLSYPVDCCPQCKAQHSVVKNGCRRSKITWLDLAGQACYLLLNKQRYLCRQCRHSFTAKTPILDSHCFISKPTKQLIASHATETMSEKLIARLTRVSPYTVRRVISSMASIIRHQPTTLPKHLCFDEFKSTKSVKAAMSFIFCDAVTHQVIDIIEDRKLKSLKAYFFRFSRKVRLNVETISIDMYTPYIHLIQQLFPNAKIIIDRFHLVQALNRELNRCRVQLMNRIQYQDSRLYRKLKRYWKLLLKDEDKLIYTEYKWFPLFDSMTNTGSIVQYLINQDEQLKYTYNTVHTLRNALKESNFTEFQATIAYARTQPIYIGLKRVLKSFSKLNTFIQSTFIYSKFTNGPIEGINNKIKVLKRTAYGYRNYSHFKDRILLISRLYISGKKKEDIKQQTVA